MQDENDEIAKNFSEKFDIIYKLYRDIARGSGTIPSNLSFSRFLGHEHDGRVRAWKRGQWPSAEDIWNIHRKMGISLAWLVSGEGALFEGQGRDGGGQHTQEAGAEALLLRIEQLEREISQKSAELARTVEERDTLLREVIVAQRENLVLYRERAAGKKAKEEPGEKDFFLMENPVAYSTKIFHEPPGPYGDEKEKSR